MPQGRRRVAFSTKQKKLQLQQKKARKRDASNDDSGDEAPANSEGTKSLFVRAEESVPKFKSKLQVRKLNQQPKQQPQQQLATFDPNRYRLHFQKESKEEVERRKKLAHTPINEVSEDTLEIDVDSVFLPGSELDIPKRPKWQYNMSKEQLDARENKYFREYLSNIEERFEMDDLSYFELNLETWRQLWRVLEISDIILIIVDIRFPALLFSPALYDHVTRDLGKDVILVLNKIDLAPANLVVAWKQYFLKRFPKVEVVCFTSFPGSSPQDPTENRVMNKKRRPGKLKMAAEGAKRLYEVCERLTTGKVDLTSWKEKIEEEMQDSEDNPAPETIVTVEKFSTDFQEQERFTDGILTIGCIGQPNVGKSSLMNAIMGKKVVSVSRTPGHTKHFQTIFLTRTVRLCDCPGLVFPSKVPKSLQILAGSFPIAQVREPYTAIRYIAERIPLQKLLKLKHPDAVGNTLGHSLAWSPFDICDAWAEKRGFITAKAARNDTYRAANNILRMAVEGKICLCMTPPGFHKNKDVYSTDEAMQEVLMILARKLQLEGEEEPLKEDEDDEEGNSGSQGSSDEDSEEPSAAECATSRNKFELLVDD